MTKHGTRPPDWPVCGTTGCLGVRGEGQEVCLAHAGTDTRRAILAALKPGADIDLRGTPVDGELMAQLLAALRPDEGPPTLGNARFDEARFSENAWFDGARFSEGAWFIGTHFSKNTGFMNAQFSGAASFEGAHFSRDADFMSAQFSGSVVSFEGVQFSGEAGFIGTQFSGDVAFIGTQFSGQASFLGTQFSENALFTETHFSEYAWFMNAKFSGAALFEGAHFSRDADFMSAQFSGIVSFHRAQFSGDTAFNEVQFKQARTFGPVLAVSTLEFNRATFEQDITIECVGARLSCAGTRFTQAASLRLRRTQVVLDGAVFAKPSIVAFAPDPFKHYNPDVGREVETFGEGPVAQVNGGRRSRPRLLSLRGVDVATLTLSELDLRACLFQGALHLDQLRIEGARPFADAPAAWRVQLGRLSVPLARRWSRRQTLAEEHHWRSKPAIPQTPGRRLRFIRPAWHGPACQTPEWVVVSTAQRVQRLTPDRLAVLYRALRKAQEDSKNEPGAADFYYGEMEMRRHDRHTPWAERVVVWLYWLSSGYGLRGVRALAWLAAVVVGLASLLQAIGFNDGDPSFRDAVIYAAQSTVSVASGNTALTEHVSWAGEVLRIVLRLAGPLLLGLALLSVRNRIKR